MTCRCIAGWVIDPDEEGPHNVKPVTCAAYIMALENLIIAGDADSLSLERVQRAHGITPRNRVPGGMLPSEMPGYDSFSNSIKSSDQFSVLTHPYVADIVANLEAWREEIMAQVVTSGSARMPEVQRERIAAYFRENGFAVWARPAEGLELTDDGYYRPIDRSKWRISE